ncbi:MAG: TonB-dependent receptor [Bacteroidia bacterium]
MKKLILCIGLCLFIQDLQAQIVLSGKVIDALDGKAIALVNVSVINESSSYSATTDELGNFLLDIPAGSYSLTFSHIAYQPTTSNITLKENSSQIYYLSKSNNLIGVTEVSALRVNRKVPSTTSYISKSEILLLDQSKDFPFLLNSSPSTVVFSDAGNGVGYTGIRIRGIDPTRVNVTINDIPLNDAEGQGVFWVNLPDMASSTASVQIQRGVGTSTNGAAAFGASVNIQTDALSKNKYLNATIGMGSFNTRRYSLSAGSGELGGGWRVQARGSYISSEGFIDRASTNLQSGQLTVGKYGKKSILKANIMLGRERTYQAWWGVPQVKFQGDQDGIENFINQLWITGSDKENLLNSKPETYNYYTYQNEVDDYGQDHYQLFYQYQIKPKSLLKTAAHYTRGKGYFEQFISEDLLSNYGIPNHVVGTDTFEYADVVRRRWLDNHFYGTVLSFHSHAGSNELTIGLSANQYLGRHFGEAIQTEFTSYESLNAIYYDNDATKNDGNAYIKYLRSFGKLKTYVDAQYRRINYQFLGIDDSGNPEEQTVNYGFFNPKFGLTFDILNNLSIKAIYAIGNREPVRDDLINSSPSSRPSHEHLKNAEFNLQFRSVNFNFSMTLYQMNYDNALVLNGQVNDVGAFTRINVESALRKGVEFDVSTNLSSNLQIMGNLSLSSNKIDNYTEYVDDWTNGGQIAYSYENTDIAFSPNAVASAIMEMALVKGVSLGVSSKYVSAQYLDNTQSDDRRLDAFSTIDAYLRYKSGKKSTLKNLSLTAYMNNITAEKYAPNGYTFSGVIDGDRNSFNYVYPMAGFNWMIKLSIAF